MISAALLAALLSSAACSRPAEREPAGAAASNAASGRAQAAPAPPDPVGRAGSDGTAAAATDASDPPAARDLPFADPARRLLLTGELQAVRNDDIKMPQSDDWPIQIRWMLPEGTEVTEGQEVIQFDNPSVLQRYEEARLSYIESAVKLRSREAQLDADRADKTYALDKARVELAKAKIEAAVPKEMRSRRDFEEKQIAQERTSAGVDAAVRDLDAFEASAKADLDVLRVALAKAEREMNRSKQIIESLSVKAPRSGVLVYGDHPWQGRKFVVGDDVFPSFTILRIPDPSRMQVLAWLSDVDDGAIEPGQEARCTLDTYPDRVFVGHVQDVAPLADERTQLPGVRAFRVLVRLDETDPALMRPGMSVKVDLERRSG